MHILNYYRNHKQTDLLFYCILTVVYSD